MKIKNLFFASLAALTFAACSNDDAPVPEGTVNFSLASVGSITKATTSPSVGAEGALNKVIIYVYDAGGLNLVKDIPVPSTEEPSTTLSYNLPIGTYKVAVVANAGQVDATSLSTLESSVIDLSTTKSTFVLFGRPTDDLAVTENGGECAVSLKRLVAGVQMGAITFELADNLEAKYLDAVNNNRVELVGITLKKSFGKAVLGTSGVSGDTEVTTGALLSATYGTQINNKIIAAPAEYSTAHRVYGYAGTALNVQLTVKYTFGDGTDALSELRYYNIENATTFAANTLYTINAKLTREGSSTPTGKDYGVSFSLSAAAWNTGEAIEAEVGN